MSASTPANNGEPQLLTRKETAELLRRSTRFVDGLLASGQLPKVKMGSSVSIPLAAIHLYIENCTEGNQ